MSVVEDAFDRYPGDLLESIHVAVGGVLELAQSQLHGPLDKGWAYGGLLALWGLWELRGAPDLTPAGPDTRRT